MSAESAPAPSVWVMSAEQTDEAERIYRAFPTREAAVAAVDAWAADPAENLQSTYSVLHGCFFLDPDADWDEPLWEVAIFEVQVES